MNPDGTRADKPDLPGIPRIVFMLLFAILVLIASITDDSSDIVFRSFSLVGAFILLGVGIYYVMRRVRARKANGS